MKKIYSIFSILCAAFLAASCITDADMEATNGGVGYLRVKVETNVNTVTRVQDLPSGYDAKKLHVEVLDANGNVAKNTDGTALTTDDYANSSVFKGSIRVPAGTYSVVAHSANWDGTQSAFNAPYYAGQTSVVVNSGTDKQASVVCTLANVKVTVNYGELLRKFVSTAQTVVSSPLLGVTSRTFTLNTTNSAYFPVGDLTLALTINNDASHVSTNTITDVKARDHYIINYELSESPTGNEGGIHVYVDDATNTYTYDIAIPVSAKLLTNINFDVKAASAMSADAFDGTSVTLTGEATGSDLQKNKVVIQYKKQSESDWTTVANDQLQITDIVDGARFSCTLTTLEAGVPYEYQLAQVDESKPATSSSVYFTIKGEDLYNGGFENWYMDGKIAICGSQGDSKYWNSSNAGAANYVGSVTTQETSFVHGGNSSAKLATKYAVIKLAAASLFTGDFIGLIGTKGAKLDWGVPFTSRPTALKGYYSYTPGAMNRGSQPSGIGAPGKGENDECQIYCALVTEQFHVANAAADGYEMTTDIDWENDPRVVAYGQMVQNTSSNGAWQELNIPLVYHSTTTKPTHLIIVCSSSRYGDYFYGSDSSVLYLDDFEMSYAGTPTVK